MNEDYLEFLCWINRILFPVDFARDLKELGLNEAVSLYYEIEWKQQVSDGKVLDILTLYQNFCVGIEVSEEDGDVGYYIQKWVDNKYQSWQSYKED